MIRLLIPKSLFFIFLFLSSLAGLSQNKGGLVNQRKGSLKGYVLFAPLHSKITYLIDKCGKQVHSWKSAYPPGQSAYLLPNGDLLRAANDSNKTFKGGGTIERFDWNGKLVWSYKISSAKECQHHDICPLPNGNVLALVWEKITPEEALKAGRDPEKLGASVWSEKIVELKPSGKNGAKIVWQWRVWDHLVQEYDASKTNYSKVAENRQLIDLNFWATKEQDWLHFNSLAYNAEQDQVMISNRNFSEIYIIDHSTTKQQAASHKGGKSDKGGDLLYRYGNRAAYNSGTVRNQIFFGQHHAHWIEKGLKDEGKIMVFNNGMGRRDSMYSSVDLLVPAMDESGNYGLFENTIYTRVFAEEEYEIVRGSIFSANVSSAQRLSNGNTLICAGATGRFCEIDETTKMVWLYINPVTINGIAPQATPPRQNQLFRCTFYEPSYSAFKGRVLTPDLPIETGPVSYDCKVDEPTR